MLHVQELTKSFQGNEVVRNVSFQLQEKQATALIGPNGAGKTTILSMLAGILEPTTGTITMNGERIQAAQIGFLPQYPKFFDYLTAAEFLKMCGELNGMAKSELTTRMEEVLQFVGLQEAQHKKTSTFSGGMKQRLGIAQAILHRPKLLILDEPVSALDPVGRREMMELLKALQQETTILYSTHILNDAEQMTDDVLFLVQGELVEADSLQAVKAKYADETFIIETVTVEHAQALAAANRFDALAEERVVTIKAHAGVTMRDIQARLLEQPFDVVKVEKKAATLEEIFMKVAKR